jgi:hypothetical protein
MAKSKASASTHETKPKKGKGTKKGTAYAPASAPLASASAPDELALLDRPRPALTRYPISKEAFAKLEQAAARAAVPKKKGSTIHRDAARAQRELAARPGVRAMAAPSPDSAEPLEAPTPAGNFAAFTDTGWFPPDCTLAAGPSHVLVSVNSSLAVFNKSNGSVALAPRTLSSWFGNVITNAKIFDPKALYDQFSNRWILLLAAVPSDANKKESYFLLSISQTGDPTKPWWNYKIDATKDGSTATNNWADYPSLGVDSQAIYVTANMFAFGGNFAYAKVRIFNKGPMLSGGTANWWDFWNLKNADGSNSFTVQPCHTFNAPGVEYLVNSYFTGATTQNKLTLWSLTNPLGAPPTLTKQTVTTAPFGQPPVADQQGGGAGLNSGDVRLLNAVFRGGSVWTALTTFHNWGETPNRAAAHWFQINATNGALIQQGIFGAKGFHYFYPAVMSDTNGNMTMVFSRCGPNEFAGIRYSGRLASDPPGTLQGSALLKAGQGNSQRIDGQGRNRWGDYAGIGADPVDPRLIWFHSMFANTNNQWGTWVGSSRF